MMDIKQIEKLARAAKLNFDDSDIKLWSETMQKIFVWLDQLAEVDTSAVTTADLYSDPTFTREDKGIISPDREAVISQIPALEENMIKVKKVL